MNKKCQRKKLMSMISLVQSHQEGSQMSKVVKLRWEGFVEEVSFELTVKEWRSGEF